MPPQKRRWSSETAGRCESWLECAERPVVRQAWRERAGKTIIPRPTTRGCMIAGGTQAPASRVIIRAVVYYAILIGGVTLAWNYLPHTSSVVPSSLDQLFGGAAPTSGVRAAAQTPLDEG